MTKRLEAKHKISRRIGQNLWGTSKSPTNKRESGPGQHGARRKNKISDFGIQLRAKQTLKGYYGNITERQFRKIFAEANRLRGDTGENMIGLLERRLDATLYRAKLAPTPFAARQIVSHGHVKVNGKRLNVASALLKPDDVIEISEKARNMALVIGATQSPERDVPDYLSVDAARGTIKLVRTPKLAEVPYPVQMNPNLIIEFYSR
ncbi:30S ribosomal protein S4 [Alphaproteobacteria bacterium SO-S41]|nr:30S ribosomal protein S4 [Alphaproteobacteria bacterium SO-S41]